MRVRSITTLAIAAILAVASLGSSASSEDDGSSGGDAGDLLTEALLLSSITTISGSLSAVDDRDWYYHNPADGTNPVCLDSKTTSEYPTDYRAALVTGSDARETVTKSGARNGIAGNGYAGGFVEVWGPQLELPPLRDYTYTSTLNVLAIDRPAWNDGDSGVDASPTEPVVTSKGCIQGALKGSWGDTKDAYTFAGNAGKSVMLSLTAYSEKVNLTLTAPDGTTLATLAINALQQVTLPTDGTYTMTTSTDHSGLLSYSIGLCEPDCEPPSTCRPMCVDMVRG